MLAVRAGKHEWIVLEPGTCGESVKDDIGQRYHESLFRFHTLTREAQQPRGTVELRPGQTSSRRPPQSAEQYQQEEVALDAVRRTQVDDALVQLRQVGMIDHRPAPLDNLTLFAGFAPGAALERLSR